MTQTLEIDLQKLRAGDKQAIEALAQYLNVYIRDNFANNILDTDVIEVLQDVLYRILRNADNLSKFSDTEHFENYCKAITRNSLAHHVHRIRQEEDVIDLYQEQLEHIEQLREETTNIDRQTYEQLVQTIRRLPSIQRKIVLLMYGENKSIREVAKELKLSISRTRRLHQHAMYRIRKQVMGAKREESTR